MFAEIKEDKGKNGVTQRKADLWSSTVFKSLPAERCFLSKTTSICDSGAIDEFRYCFDGDGKFPVAIVLGSDGIDDSFDTEENQVNFYVQTLESIVKNGIDTEKTTFLFLSFGSKDTPRPSQKRRGGKRKIDVCPKTPRIFSLILYRTNCSNRMDFGFLKIAAATPGVKAGDCSHNIARISGLIR